MPVSALLISNPFIRSNFDLSPKHLHEFHQVCSKVQAYFRAHPEVQKIRRKRLPHDPQDLPISDWSFLNLGPWGIYVLSKTILGRGKFARVKYALKVNAEATDLAADQLWVVKIQSSDEPREWSEHHLTFEEIKMEADIGRLMGFFSHPLFTREAKPRHKHYLIGRYEGVNLEQWLKTQPSSHQRLTVAIRLCLMVHDMHENKKIVHRDIKSVNVLVDPVHLTIVLGDFGFSRALDPRPSNLVLCGTPYYLPLSYLRITEEQVARIEGWMSEPQALLKFDVFALRRLLQMPDLGISNPSVKLPNFPTSLLDQSILADLPVYLKKILHTYPVDEQIFRCGSVTPSELAARLFLFQTDPGNPQPSIEHWTKQYEAEVLKAYHKIQPQLIEWVLSNTTMTHLRALLKNQQVIDAFEIVDCDVFLQQCKEAWNYFHAYPGEQKLSRRYVGEGHISFLKIENAVYAISRIKMGGPHANKRVKLAIRITKSEAQWFTVKIRYAEHPIPTVKEATWHKELAIGQKMGFFKQERLFSRLSVHANKKHKAYLVAPHLGRDLRAWLTENSGSWQRLWVAFNLCVAIHEMHTGSEPFVHQALKPKHILVDEQGNVRMINYSQASFYMKSTVKRDPHEFCRLGAWEDVLNASRYASEMDAVQMDIFALKHILKITNQTDERCILNAPIFDTLPETLRTMIDTTKPRLGHHKDTLLEIGARLALVIFRLEAPEIMDRSLQADIVSFVQQVFLSSSAYQSNCVFEEQERHLEVILQQTGFEPKRQGVDWAEKERISPDAAASQVFSEQEPCTDTGHNSLLTIKP